jgi:hypothetical protein
MDWIDLAQDREECRTLVNTVMNLRLPYNARSCQVPSCTTGGFSRRAQLQEVSWEVTRKVTAVLAEMRCSFLSVPADLSPVCGGNAFHSLLPLMFKISGHC